jgi:hypothetical protein
MLNFDEVEMSLYFNYSIYIYIYISRKKKSETQVINLIKRICTKSLKKNKLKNCCEMLENQKKNQKNKKRKKRQLLPNHWKFCHIHCLGK